MFTYDYKNTKLAQLDYVMQIRVGQKGSMHEGWNLEVKQWLLFSDVCVVTDRLLWIPVCLLLIVWFVFPNTGHSNTGQGPPPYD